MTEITYSRSLKLNKGNYEQDAPMFCEKAIFEGDFDYEAESKALQERVNKQILAYQNNLNDVRIREKDGVKYPSVTSILYPNKLDIDPEYAIRGHAVHDAFYESINHGSWQEPKVKLKKLRYDQLKCKEFWDLKTDDIVWTQDSKPKEIYNEKYQYSGELDLYCEIGGFLVLADIKTGTWTWEQLVAYWKCEPVADQLAIFDLKKCNLHTLDPTSEEAEECWEKFLIKRGSFKERFGV